MSKDLLFADAKPALQVLRWQCGVAIIVIISASYWGGQQSYSAALGVGISLISTAYFMWQAFGINAVIAPELVLRRFYRGFFGKLILIVCGFLFVYKFVSHLASVFVLIGFVLMQISMCVKLILVVKN